MKQMYETHAFLQDPRPHPHRDHFWIMYLIVGGTSSKPLLSVFMLDFQGVGPVPT